MSVSLAGGLRVLLVGVAFLSAVALPPWVPFLCALLLALRFPAWEVIVLGVFIDLAWLPMHVSAGSFPLASVIALTLVWGLEPVRRELLESGPMRFITRPFDLV